MKNEHIEFDELYRLAEIEVQGEVYSEEEKKELQHLIECEECYERYCAAALSLAALDGINAETLAVMRKKVTLKRRKENLPNSESIFRQPETEKTLKRCARNRVGKGGRKKIGIGDFNNFPKGS